MSAADLVMGMGRLAIFPFCLFVLCYAMLLLLLSHFSHVRLCVTPSLDSPGNNSGVGCHFLLQCIKVKSESEITQSCLTLLHPMDCSLPGSSIHGIFQARVLEWDAIAFSSAMQQILIIYVYVCVCYPVSFQQLSILYVVVYICQSRFPSLSHPTPLLVLIHLFSVCVSVSALQIGSSVLFFQLPHTCVNI